MENHSEKKLVTISRTAVWRVRLVSFISLTALLILSSGCTPILSYKSQRSTSPGTITEAQWNKIRTGMSAADVQTELGQPSYKYCAMDAAKTEVWHFVGGRDSYEGGVFYPLVSVEVVRHQPRTYAVEIRCNVVTTKSCH
jgi:hypothetical protein